MSTKNSGDLATEVARGIEVSSRTSPTPPGQSEVQGNREPPDPSLVEAINQVFALFRLNYHNQYYAAFSDAEQLRQIKKLWLESLRDYPPALLLHGARLAIENSEYLPTLNRMRQCCDDSYDAVGLPALDSAYREACNSAAPQEAHPWSHPAVYWAGRDCGWQFLAGASEKAGKPRFTEAYRARCAALLGGGSLPDIPAPETPTLESKALPPEAALQQLRRLREDSGI